MPSSEGASQRDVIPPGRFTAAEALAIRARESILSHHVNETILPGGIPPETLVAAENLLRGDAAAGCGQSRREWREAQAREQHTILREAARPSPLPGRYVANEGEHLVHGGAQEGFAFKATNNERYGLVLDQDEWSESRKLTMRPALPSEYLWRLGLQNAVFGDTIRVIGIAKGGYGGPVIQTAQPWLAGSPPSMPEVQQFMESAGFRPLPKGMLAARVPGVLTWYRIADEVLVYDTKPSNFVKSEEGVLDPIDLVVSIYPRGLLAETARINGVEWPEIMRDE